MNSIGDATRSPLHSSIYTGSIYHTRTKPSRHAFRYAAFFCFLDLDEIEQIFERCFFWSIDRFNLGSFKRSDYHGNPEEPLKEEVKATIKEMTGLESIASVRILTNLRYFGFVFNPITFYYCYDSSNDLKVILSEVENTPWGERYCYAVLVDQVDTDELEEDIIHTSNKEFHVSPFMPMNMKYHWKLSRPTGHLKLEIKSSEDGEMIFSAELDLERKPISSKNLNWMLLRYPFMTLRTVFGIYWQALRLYLKKVPVFAHPNSQKKSKGNSDIQKGSE